jgi:hypothetical protein
VAGLLGARGRVDAFQVAGAVDSVKHAKKTNTHTHTHTRPS